ncbi:MAG: hypothetical protein ABR98_01875 [Cryomorphaceae bacterium BACL7 MAG-120910-bin2]|jgi:hypothetical protein|nr:MAG: hypothetical protein ABR98_01875 [Cryomorphaceae bacterium BACL7 MAG-120910-bin2]KRO69268.1 MAG: hypothetical protein ABR88_04415 [Cryomorphaceae bacterium BACL7 MAG-120322-bin74]KRO82137.1 MAG: hypothetical protein ABR87_00070 [Cryomorphaceae bacterium BACL7 MAG-121220-bin83]NQW25039.1 hypothetical protein [Cryomorphaceae bacterium]|tara:strand:+ start:170 stop:709 length:540 start_codon:yes stop_codon:yes gene_type:complete
MDWIYQLSTRYRTSQWLKAKKLEVAHLPWKGWAASKRVGILFDAHSNRTDLEPLREVVAHWKAKQRSVTLCGWTGQMRPKNVLYNGRQLIFTDDFTWRGAPESGNALEFMQTEFDVLIVLHRTSGTPLDALAAKTPAGMRICAAGDQDFYDLCMLPEGSHYIPYTELLSAWLTKIAPTL